MAQRPEEWALGRKAVEIPTPGALARMEDGQLSEVAQAHHAAARRIVQEALPHAVVAGLCLLEARRRVDERGEGWVRWCDSNWPLNRSSATEYMGVARTYLGLVESGRAPRPDSEGVALDTLRQSLRAIGCAETARVSRETPAPATPPAREAPPVPPSSPPPIDKAEAIDATFSVEEPLGKCDICLRRAAVRRGPSGEGLCERCGETQDRLRAAGEDHLDMGDDLEEEDTPAAAPPAPDSPAPTSAREAVEEDRGQEVLDAEAEKRLATSPTDVRAVRWLAYGQEQLPDLRASLRGSLALEQLVQEGIDAQWKLIDACLAAPKPAGANPLEWLSPSTRRRLTAVRDALAPVVTLAEQQVLDLFPSRRGGR